MLLFIGDETLYKNQEGYISKHLMLLFISFSIGDDDHMLVFQNISCYCLSMIAYKIDVLETHFKTSHVIVYLTYVDIIADDVKHFKTSHVIVYPRSYGICWARKIISKHLMLLFIGNVM